VADVVEFYVPTVFQKRVVWTPPDQRGKVIKFCPKAEQRADDSKRPFSTELLPARRRARWVRWP
jgi:hypothetical protein